MWLIEWDTLEDQTISGTVFGDGSLQGPGGAMGLGGVGCGYHRPG